MNNFINSFWILSLFQLFRINSFRTIYIRNEFNPYLHNASLTYKNKNMDKELKYIGETPDIFYEPDLETIEYNFVLYKKLQELKLSRRICVQNLIVTADIRDISLCAGGLYDDYNFPEF